MTVTQLSLFAAPTALSLERRRRELAGFEASLHAMPAGDWRRAWMTVLIDDARRTLAALVALQQLPDAMPAPEPPRSADISAWTAYLHALEHYADALEAELSRRPRPPQVEQLALFETKETVRP
jgi:hypothetical protein